MKQLSGARGWEYAYRKKLDEELAIKLEHMADGAVAGNFQFLQGEIHGIRVATRLLDEVRQDYRLDDDADDAI